MKGGRRKAEGGRRKAEGGRRKAEGGRRKAEISKEKNFFSFRAICQALFCWIRKKFRFPPLFSAFRIPFTLIRP